MQRIIDGTEYTFKMTRKGLRVAERAGFTTSMLTDAPQTAAVYLWYAALDGKIPMKKAEELLDNYLDDESCPENFADIYADLAEQYGEVFE